MAGRLHLPPRTINSSQSEPHHHPHLHGTLPLRHLQRGYSPHSSSDGAEPRLAQDESKQLQGHCLYSSRTNIRVFPLYLADLRRTDDHLSGLLWQRSVLNQVCQAVPSHLQHPPPPHLLVLVPIRSLPQWSALQNHRILSVIFHPHRDFPATQPQSLFAVHPPRPRNDSHSPPRISRGRRASYLIEDIILIFE